MRINRNRHSMNSLFSGVRRNWHASSFHTIPVCSWY